MLLLDPVKKEPRGARANPPGQLEIVSAVSKGSLDNSQWVVTWRSGPKSTITTTEHHGVVWHMHGKDPDGRHVPFVDRVEMVPWGGQ